MDQAPFPRLLAVTGIIKNHSGKILLTWRTESPDENTWQLTGGYIKPGERLVDAMKRQVKDKAGIADVLKVSFTGHYYDDPTRIQPITVFR